MSFASTFSRKIHLIATCLICALPKLYSNQNSLNDLSNHPKDDSSSWVLSADFLAWFASEEVTSIWADLITIGDNTSSWEALGFNFDWSYGFRIGVGYNLVYDQWDTALYWTWFRTCAEHTIPSQPNATISPEFFAAFLSGDKPESMSTKWNLLFNMFNWDLGRSYWASKHLSLRPFLGIKGGWINQAIFSHYYNLTIDNILTTHYGTEQVKNNFWGIGPLGGIKTKWRFSDFGSHFFDLFGDFSMATMWGTWSCGDMYRNTASKTSSVNMKDSNLGALMLQGFLGIGWDTDFQKGNSHLSTKLGYEMQIWLNQLRIATFQLQRLHGDLTLQGITLNCRFDF